MKSSSCGPRVGLAFLEPLWYPGAYDENDEDRSCSGNYTFCSIDNRSRRNICSGERTYIRTDDSGKRFLGTKLVNVERRRYT